MSRRTERPYKVDGADKLAPHSAVPEINGPVVQREFTSLLRETYGLRRQVTTSAGVRCQFRDQPPGGGGRTDLTRGI